MQNQPAEIINLRTFICRIRHWLNRGSGHPSPCLFMCELVCGTAHAQVKSSCKLRPTTVTAYVAITFCCVTPPLHRGNISMSTHDSVHRPCTLNSVCVKTLTTDIKVWPAELIKQELNTFQCPLQVFCSAQTHCLRLNFSGTLRGPFLNLTRRSVCLLLGSSLKMTKLACCQDIWVQIMSWVIFSSPCWWHFAGKVIAHCEKTKWRRFLTYCLVLPSVGIN